ncbi:hypothetical protein EJ02DRAFT_486824 [Clathrospora elynae]|uniref:Uncharacterized protein n=1 Tax=Clathrospora elynae TaxID=706981 RepID=A0A6A5SCE9_9PLEO|nr:hypothetical protein EJ02DRAFT_486824 [Clathrospora elynae]
MSAEVIQFSPEYSTRQLPRTIRGSTVVSRPRRNRGADSSTPTFFPASNHLFITAMGRRKREKPVTRSQVRLTAYEHEEQQINALVTRIQTTAGASEGEVPAARSEINVMQYCHDARMDHLYDRVVRRLGGRPPRTARKAANERLTEEQSNALRDYIHERELMDLQIPTTTIYRVDEAMIRPSLPEGATL